MKKFLLSTLLLAGGFFALNHHTEAGVLKFDDCNPTQPPLLTISSEELNLFTKDSELYKNQSVFTENPNITPSAIVVLDKYEEGNQKEDSVIDVLWQDGEDFQDTIFSTHDDWMSTPFVITKHGLEYAVAHYKDIDNEEYGNPNYNYSYDEYMEYGDPVLGPHGGFLYIVAYQRNHQVDSEGHRIFQLYPVEVLVHSVFLNLDDHLSHPNA